MNTTYLLSRVFKAAVVGIKSVLKSFHGLRRCLNADFARKNTIEPLPCHANAEYILYGGVVLEGIWPRRSTIDYNGMVTSCCYY